MKKTLLLVVAALMVPSVALAAKPAHTQKPPKPAPQVTYELKGTLSAYTAYNSVGPVNGTVTIKVSDANPHGKALKGQTLTFVVDANTAISLKSGLTTITDGDTGMVRVMAAKSIPPANLAATLQASPAKAIHDRGVKPVQMRMYTLKGTLSKYTAYDKVTPANGTVTLVVKNATPHGKSLKGMTLVFTIDAMTKVKLNDGLTTITDGDKGIIKVRAPKKIAKADLAATLQASPAKTVHDLGAPKPKS
jgi:sulfur relay (sulfurtransferase) DsrF/TusC family protein